jgi:hypothetical protein
VTARLPNRFGPDLRSGELQHVDVVDQVLDGRAAVRAPLAELGEGVGLEVVGHQHVAVDLDEPRPEQGACSSRSTSSRRGSP